MNKYKLINKRTALLLLVAGFVGVNAGCGSSKNYAPVRDSFITEPLKKKRLNKAKYYAVKRGDTLYSIGFRSSNSYQELARWNNIAPPYRLQIGQKIKLFEPKQGIKKKTRTVTKQKKKVAKLSWSWPIKGRVIKKFSLATNKGVDISGKLGQTVKAAAAGKVVYSGSGLINYGNLLIVKHDSVYLSAYANNSRLLVNEGQTVTRGQAIAEVGFIRGRQAALHFEIRKNGKPLNPLQFLPKM